MELPLAKTERLDVHIAMLSYYITLLYIILYMFYIMVKCYYYYFFSFIVIVCDCEATIKVTYLLKYVRPLP